MKTGIIYVHKNKENGKIYVGSTIQKPTRRWRRGNLSSYKSCTLFYRALQLYGWDSFDSEIIETNIPFDQISEREEFYIQKYNSLAPNGYNLNKLIDGRVVFSEETKKKISDFRKEYYASLTEPVIAHNRKEHKIIDGNVYKECTSCKDYKPLNKFGVNNNNWDKLMHYCQICWIDNKKKQKTLSDEEWSNSYKKRSADIRRSIIANYTNNPETRLKQSKSHQKPLIAKHTITGEILKFTSGLDAKAKGFNNTNLKIAMNKNKPYKGYMWSYDIKDASEPTDNKYLIFAHEKNDPIKAAIWASIQNENKTPIYARDCEIKELDSKTQTDFMTKNHIQGSINARVKYGLYYLNELVAAMTFGTSRYNKNYQWELLRFCNKLNTRVVGGASKLLSHFIKTHNPISIISYANLRFSEGNLYEKLGFKKLGKSSPNYFYEKDGKIYSRVKFQKHKLPSLLPKYDPTKSEKDNMVDNGYVIINDRGNLIYVWSLNVPTLV